MTEPRLVADIRLELGECILWDDRWAELVRVDIHKGAVWRWAPGGDVNRHVLPDRVGSVG